MEAKNGGRLSPDAAVSQAPENKRSRHLPANLFLGSLGRTISARLKRGRFLCRAVGIALLIVLGMSGCASQGSARFTPAETMMWATYPLASERSIGTCFLVAMKDQRAVGGLVPVIVTSAHVVRSAGKGPIYLPLRMLDREGNFSLAVFKIATTEKNKRAYVTHPRYDVAAMELQVPSDAATPFYLLLLEEKNLVKAGEPRVGEDVSFLGFPEGLPATSDLFPVLRGGRIASYDPGLSATEGFLVNGDVYRGDSGGPVFRAAGNGDPKLLGMVINQVSLHGRQPFPVALAVKTNVIRETLQLLAKRRAGPD